MALMGGGSVGDAIKPAKLARAAEMADSPNCAALFSALAAL